MADITLVLERVELGDDLVGTEVSRLEVAPLSAILPGPADSGGIRETLVEVTGTSDVLSSGALSLQVVIDERCEGLPGRPSVDYRLCAFGLCPSFSWSRLIGLGVSLDVVAKGAEASSATVYTIRLPKVENGGEGIGKGSMRVGGRTLAKELLLELGSRRTVGVQGMVDVLDRSLNILSAIAKAVPVHAAVYRLEVKRLVNAGLDRRRRSVSSIDGIRVLVADKSGAHSRVRATNEDPWCFVRSQSSVDIFPLKLLGELVHISQRLLRCKISEGLSWSVEIDRRGC